MVANPSHAYRTTVDPSASNNPHSYALELVGGGHRVLEIGCSSGHVTEHLIAAGNTVVGVEIDEAAAIEARQVTEVVHVIDLDFVNLSSVENGEFDVVVLGDVLEHVRNPSAVLADVASLLVDDGRLVISVPNAAHVDVRLMLLEGRIEYQNDGLLDRTHLRWFTKASFRELLAECGFIATEMRRVFVPLGDSNVPFDRTVHDRTTIDFVMADPDALSYQYVIEARRSHCAGTSNDVLAPVDFEWPEPPSTIAERERELMDAELARLRDEVAAWEASRIVRWSRPLRALSGRTRSMLGTIRARSGE